MPRAQKNGCGCRRCRRRTVRDEDRGGGDRGSSVQPDRAPAGAAEAADRPTVPDGDLVSAIKAVIADLPTYGYRRVHAILKRRAMAESRQPPNHKRVYRVMKVHGLLLDRHCDGAERRHDGRIAVDERNRRWCSDGFEIGCDNGEKVRVAFALDCCDREAMSFLATIAAVNCFRTTPSGSFIYATASARCPLRGAGLEVKEFTLICPEFWWKWYGDAECLTCARCGAGLRRPAGDE